MKYGLIASVFIALAVAQVPNNIPSCARPCIDAASASATTCGSDAYCQCGTENQSKIQTGSTACVIGACGADVAISMLPFSVCS